MECVEKDIGQGIGFYDVYTIYKMGVEMSIICHHFHFLNMLNIQQKK